MYERSTARERMPAASSNATRDALYVQLNMLRALAARMDEVATARKDTVLEAAAELTVSDAEYKCQARGRTCGCLQFRCLP